MENKKIHYYEELDSTNVKAIELAGDGAEHGTIVAADRQTKGRGRRGRSWESPAGENICMSIVLRPQCQPNQAPMLTLVMAYSVAEIIKRQGFPNVQIKWPNDIIISGKKVCGILTEMQLDGSEMTSVIVGVGINVNTKQFSEELEDKATSLFLESGRVFERKSIIEQIAAYFEQVYQEFVKKYDLSFFQTSYNSMLVNVGSEVRVLEPGNEYTAFACGIDEKGELIVRTHSGEEKKIYAGEVSVRGVYGYV